MRIILDWLGVSTFRLMIGDLVIFLDGYIDRVPAAPPVGITTADIERADYARSSAHFTIPQDERGLLDELTPVGGPTPTGQVRQLGDNLNFNEKSREIWTRWRREVDLNFQTAS
jgi:hypothetical protein